MGEKQIQIKAEDDDSRGTF